MRRVEFKGHDDTLHQGWFHVWAGTSEYAHALVECDSGQIICVPCMEVRFLESRQALNLELWEPYR